MHLHCIKSGRAEVLGQVSFGSRLQTQMLKEARHVKESSQRGKAVVTCRGQVPSKREGCYPVTVNCPCEGCSPNVAIDSDFLSHATTSLHVKIL